jgi:predicted ATPase
MKNDADVYKELIDQEILNIKCLTQEAVYLTPLTVYFSPSAADKSLALDALMSGYAYDFVTNDTSYIEITLDDNTLYSNNDI